MGRLRITPDVVLDELRPDDGVMLILPAGGHVAQGSGRQRGFRRDSVQLRLEHGQGLCVNRRASKPGQTSRAAISVSAFMLDRARRAERDDRMTALSASAWHAQQRTGTAGGPQQGEQIDRSGASAGNGTLFGCQHAL